MKQLKEQIKKEIIKLTEEKYKLPVEIMDALRDDLNLNPLLRYIEYTKAASTVPPSYEIFLRNKKSFFIIYEDFSLAVEIENKKYYIGDMEELNMAKRHLNHILKEPLITLGDSEADTESSGETEDTPTEEEPEA